MAKTEVQQISIAHSPDSDDAFMFYGLATNKVRVPGIKFTHTLCDIETLNHEAREGGGKYDVSAISFHAYPYLQKDYALMACGGSVGEDYGPMIVANRQFNREQIQRVRVAIPGTLTTVCAGDRDLNRSLRPDHSAGAGGQVRRGSHHP